MLNALKRSGSSALLLSINAAVAATAIGLVALTVIQHYKETPEIKTLACGVGLPRTDCPDYANKFHRLESEIDALRDEKSGIENRLAALRAIETTVDTVTLFETKTDPSSGSEITVGTVYKNLTAVAPQPEHYFCYIKLANGPAGESRNLHFQTASGSVAVSPLSLKEAGVDAGALNFGRSVCKPLLIGQPSPSR